MSQDYSYPSPDGKYGFLITAWEARMSLWIETPTLVDRQTNTTLLKFTDGNWSLDAAKWEDNGVVHLQLRKYPGGHVPSVFGVSVDCSSGMVKVGDMDVVPVEQTEKVLESFIKLDD